MRFGCFLGVVLGRCGQERGLSRRHGAWGMRRHTAPAIGRRKRLGVVLVLCGAGCRWRWPWSPHSPAATRSPLPPPGARGKSRRGPAVRRVRWRPPLCAAACRGSQWPWNPPPDRAAQARQKSLQPVQHPVNLCLMTEQVAQQAGVHPLRRDRRRAPEHVESAYLAQLRVALQFPAQAFGVNLPEKCRARRSIRQFPHYCGVDPFSPTTAYSRQYKPRPILQIPPIKPVDFPAIKCYISTRSVGTISAARRLMVGGQQPAIIS